MLSFLDMVSKNRTKSCGRLIQDTEVIPDASFSLSDHLTLGFSSTLDDSARKFRTDKFGHPVFKNSGLRSATKGRECQDFRVKTFLANLDPQRQRVPHGNLSRVSSMSGFQLRSLIKTIGILASRCQSCPVAESPVCLVPGPADSSRDN